MRSFSYSPTGVPDGEGDGVAASEKFVKTRYQLYLNKALNCPGTGHDGFR